MADKRNLNKSSSSENSGDELHLTDDNITSEKDFMDAVAVGFDANVPELSKEISEIILGIIHETEVQQEVATNEIEVIEISSASPQDDSEGTPSESLDNVKIIYEFPDEDCEAQPCLDLPGSSDSIEHSSHKETEPKATESRNFSNQAECDNVFEKEANFISPDSSSNGSEFDEPDSQMSLEIIVHNHAMGYVSPDGSVCCCSSGNLADVEDNIECSRSVSEHPNLLAENERNPVINNTSSTCNISESSEPELMGLAAKKEQETQKHSNSSKETYTPVVLSDNIQTPDPSPMPSTSKQEWNRLDNSVDTNNRRKIRSDVARNKKRQCRVCKKKLDLTAITCRCGGLFCAKHRYDREHGCTFDYKSMGAEKIRKENPKVTAEKVTKL
ncbi:AN1-type zinc finger protein 5-like [Parasteatoda tepidariorum]|uniref:AN1-type zinc finger protein 5-like n=1 Tax=Parasteatoda tepidariorum TaxID=114398 RepID=UPI0039BC4820